MKGYKKTEIGVIPEDWEVDKLENISYSIGDGIHSTPKYIKISKYYFINGNNIVNSKIKIDSNTKCIDYEEYKKYLINLDNNTILLSINGTIGNVAIYNNENVILGKSAAYIKLNQYVDVKYIYYQLQSNKVYDYYNKELTGSTIKNLSLKSIRNLSIPIPPLQEQKTIAKVLSDIDSLIENLDKLIQKKKLIKKGVMQELLTGKRRLPGFKGEWVRKKLGEISKFRRGSFPQPYNLDKWYDNIKGKPFIQVVDVQENLKVKKETKQKISKLAEKFSVLAKKDDIILTIQGSIGRGAILPYDAYVDRTLLIFQSLDKDIDKYFFLLKIIELFEKEKKYATGGIIKSITKEKLKNFEISLPPTLEEQKAIAKILSDIDADIESLERKKEKYEKIKKGTMELLLSGKVRLRRNSND